MYFDCKINNFYDYGIDLYDNYHMQCFLIPILSIIIALNREKGSIFVEIAFCYSAILLNAPIAQERPPLTHGFASFDAHLDYLALLLLAKVCNELTLRACNKAMPPELYTVCHSRRVGLMAAAVDSDDRKSVGYSMSALHCLPGSKLPFLLLRGVGTFPAYCGGVYEDIGSAQRHQTGTFGVPLVPTYLHSKHAYRGTYRTEALVAGCKVEFLVIGRVVGDMHLAVFSGDTAIAVKYYCCVMIKPFGTSLE